MILEELKKHLDNAVAHLQKQFSTLQAGRANVAMVEDIHVDSYGSSVALKTTANISTPDPKTIRIEPWDKTLVAEIEKAIQTEDIGINPQNMGDYLILPIPPMTEERRKKLVKIVHEEAESARIAIRSARAEARDFIKMQKDEKEISEDEAERLEKQVQEKVDEANKKVEELSHGKEQDILKI